MIAAPLLLLVGRSMTVHTSLLKTQDRAQPARFGRSHAATVRPIGHGSRGERPLKVALIGTFGPRKCGIATFTGDVRDALLAADPAMVIDVYALDWARKPHRYAAGVVPIVADDAADCARAAARINASGADVVWIQHEYGIYGGHDGAMIRELVDRIAGPIVFTLHTVLHNPSPGQRAVMMHLVARAARIMVLSREGRDLLVRDYGLPRDRIDLIAHGAPDRPFGRAPTFKQRLGLSGRKTLTTFGLLGPGKGIEQAIEALPAIVARHPDAIYHLIGATHPELVAREGEAYREQLQARAVELGVADHIRWENRFLDCDELLDMLEACDVYLTPYLNLDQATSGTLSYAVALGKAVVSTPYVHATELLANDVGVLVPARDPAAIAATVNRLFDDPELLSAYQRRAFARGRATLWTEFARHSLRMLRRAAGAMTRAMPAAGPASLDAMRLLTDSTGMMQHAIGIVPDRRHGYCIDDNARALIVMNTAGRDEPDYERLALTYASFMQYGWNAARGRFRNFMHYDRRWCEDMGSEDSNGRTLWALGHTARHSPLPGLRAWASEWFDRFINEGEPLQALRATAFAMLGAAEVLAVQPAHGGARALIERGGARLAGLYRRNARPDWRWFETFVSYDNPRLAQALIEAGLLCRRSDWIATGQEALAWLCAQQTAAAGHFRAIGSEGFGHAGDMRPFDQQPLEALAAIEAAAAAWRASGDARWPNEAVRAFGWFEGANDRGVAIADRATGRCRDGLTPRGANENVGAESVLAYALACHVMQRWCEPAALRSFEGEELVDATVTAAAAHS